MLHDNILEILFYSTHTYVYAYITYRYFHTYLCVYVWVYKYKYVRSKYIRYVRRYLYV